ncbi:helix-turn-helix transcriptional regulator [Robiginitalea biformata]|uniref:Regulatory protein, LuxR:Response regulator receiver n=1 Tax=Robiginitalea biformata (strain ATCC BAA-864 / DSM 15991 / KCTC 12146 / HTCC2501) TaxID=313596 RepID=A4CJK3_ROBBH|nr:helix-turn-helix transcriptional regulator [Robiginitalea biformata]EAR17111.1 regulatory protein, LuxR:Response regulator receiver [Robiginitalea biformata HTCC2501]
MDNSETWTETYNRLKSSSRDSMSADTLATYATAAYLTGRDEESFDLMDRAHRAYLDKQDRSRALRCIFWLGLMLMNNGEMTRSSGWLSRGMKLLESAPRETPSEKGLFLIPKALETLSRGLPKKARDLFSQAAGIGEKCKDNDLLALGQLGKGQALIHSGAIKSGGKLFDELLVVVDAGEVYPIVSGIVYCAVIETCRKVWDIRRAQVWTAALTKWCSAQPDIVPFKGQCMARRGEILQLQGDWHRALREVDSACNLLARYRSGAAGEAYYRKGELYRLLGSYKEAESCFGQSANWGRKPQPGLALLRLAQGKTETATTSIQTALRETHDSYTRMELLPAAIDIWVAGESLQEANEGLKELRDGIGRVDAPLLKAQAAYASGLVRFAEGNLQDALEHLNEALNHIHVGSLPYLYARVRELKGRAYLEVEDRENCTLELSGARWVYEQLRAKPDLERIQPVLHKTREHPTRRLTLRELQVLRLIASGMTNKSAARELFISERTVDRHVSNIFDKLGVSSRVAATVVAIKHKLIDAPG